MNKTVLLFIIAVIVLCNSIIVSATGDEVISATGDVVASSSEVSETDPFDWFDRTAEQMLKGHKAIKQLHEFSQLDPAIQIKYSLSKYLAGSKQIDYNRQAIGRLMLFTLNAIVDSHKNEPEATGINSDFISSKLKELAVDLNEKIKAEKVQYSKKPELTTIKDKVENAIECIVFCSTEAETIKKNNLNQGIQNFCNRENFLQSQMEAATIFKDLILDIYKSLSGKKSERRVRFPETNLQYSLKSSIDEHGVLNPTGLNQLNDVNTACKAISNMYQYFIIREKAKIKKGDIQQDVIGQVASTFVKVVKTGVSVASAAVTASIAGGITGGSIVGPGTDLIPFVVPASTRLAAFGAESAGSTLESVVNDKVREHYKKLNVKRKERISLAEMALTLINGWPFETKSADAETFGSNVIDEQNTANLAVRQTDEDDKRAMKSQATQILRKIKDLQNRYHRKMDHYNAKSASPSPSGTSTSTDASASPKMISLKTDHEKAMKALQKEATDLGMLSDAGKKNFGDFIVDILKKTDADAGCETELGYTLKFFKWMFDDPSKWQTENEHAFKIADLVSESMEKTPFSDMLDSRGARYLSGIMNFGIEAGEVATYEIKKLEKYKPPKK